MTATVLVVEDQPANAREGIACARERHPDLILMDIQLPNMDGLEASRLLKRDDERMLAAGCDGYIAKPIEYRQFLAEVARLLAAS